MPKATPCLDARTARTGCPKRASAEINVREAYSDPLLTAVEIAQEHLHLPDPGSLVLSIAAVAANQLTGPPVWLMVVGPPSSGKSMAVCAVSGVANVHETATLTEAALLSGTSKKEKTKESTGGLLKVMGPRGVLLMKDFTSVLEMSRETRGPAMAALREIFDGKWTRNLGTDGGIRLSWSGKMGLLAGVTEKIDSHHAVISAMGDRFLYFRMPESDGTKIAHRVLSGTATGAEAVQDAVAGLFVGLDPPVTHSLSANEQDWLTDLAIFTAHGRSAVERDYRKEIVNVLPPESPGRLAGSMGQLYRALAIIGCKRPERKRLVRKVALDSIPRIRARLLERLAGGGGVRACDLVDDGPVRVPDTTVRRALEEMDCLKMVDRTPGVGRNADTWTISAEWQERWASIHK